MEWNPDAYPATISIHAPLTGSDQANRKGREGRSHFNPRSPYGERLFVAASI